MSTESPLRRYVESTALVAVWMICGWLFRLSVEAYLVLGVPLLGIFQIAVRRRPLRELWVREPGQPFRLDRLSWMIGTLLLLVPTYLLITLTLPQRNLPSSLFALCAMAGGIVASGALRSQRAEALRRALPSFGAALLIGIAIQAIDPINAGRSPIPSLTEVPFMLQKFLLYFAVSFILEEVAFRGALDTHVFPPGESKSWTRYWGSAFYASVLWAVWHLPLAGEFLGVGFVEALAIVLFVHVLEGIPLSFCWRQGGTLVLPSIAHALIDAYRDALMA